jgi:hypothetical protein
MHFKDFINDYQKYSKNSYESFKNPYIILIFQYGIKSLNLNVNLWFKFILNKSIVVFL